MGSSNGKRRPKGSDWREKLKDRQRRLAMESLENRRLLSTATTASYPPLWHPTNSNLADAQHGPMADEGVDLVGIYQNYETYLTVHQQSDAGYVSPRANQIFFQGNKVEIDARGYGPSSTFVTNLQTDGMQVLSRP